MPIPPVCACNNIPNYRLLSCHIYYLYHLLVLAPCVTPIYHLLVLAPCVTPIYHLLFSPHSPRVISFLLSLSSSPPLSPPSPTHRYSLSSAFHLWQKRTSKTSLFDFQRTNHTRLISRWLLTNARQNIFRAFEHWKAFARYDSYESGRKREKRERMMKQVITILSQYRLGVLHRAWGQMRVGCMWVAERERKIKV